VDGGGRGTEAALTAALLVAAVAFAAAGWRWGYPAEVAIGAITFFLFLARLPGGRWGWVLAGLVVAAASWPARTRRSLPPPMRGAASAVFVVAVAAIYAAVNRYSVDQHAIEAMARGASFSPSPASAVLAALSTVATGLVPVALIVGGVRRRQTLVLDLGIVFAALSLVTLRHYVHLAPLWVVLTLAGAALVVLALAVERALRHAPGGEIAGFTADPLFADERRQHALQIVPVVAAFTAAPGPAAADKGIGAGGRFGGGGADEKF